MRSWTKLSLKVDKNRHRQSLYTFASVCTTYFRRLFECACKQERGEREVSAFLLISLVCLTFSQCFIAFLQQVSDPRKHSFQSPPCTHTHIHTAGFTATSAKRNPTEHIYHFMALHHCLHTLPVDQRHHYVIHFLLEENPPQYTVGRDVHTHTLCNWN